MPSKRESLPGTLQRSPKKAQKTYEKTLDNAHDEYNSEERAHRTAFAAVKHSFEKVGDHWEPKKKRGPSDASAKQRGPNNAPTAGGVDVIGHSKDELMQRARKLEIKGRSNMTKQQLGEAISKKQD